MEAKVPRLVSVACTTPDWNALYISFEGGVTMLAPAACHIAAKVGPAARNLTPLRSAGFSMQPVLDAMPPANHASDKTMTPLSAMILRMSVMNWDWLIRLARAGLRIRPGISVALKAGTLPLA